MCSSRIVLCCWPKCAYTDRFDSLVKQYNVENAQRHIRVYVSWASFLSVSIEETSLLTFLGNAGFDCKTRSRMTRRDAQSTPTHHPPTHSMHNVRYQYEQGITECSHTITAKWGHTYGQRTPLPPGWGTERKQHLEWAANRLL